MTALSDEVAGRVADSLADLADALNGFRAWVDKAQAEEEAEKAAKEARDARDKPAEWQAALDEVRDFLNGELLGHTPDGFEVSPEGEKVERLVAALDDRLRRYSTGLRYAFETLSERPPEDLRKIAEQRATDHGCTEEPARGRFIDAWIAGRTEGLR